jgi:hypothetical protein
MSHQDVKNSKDKDENNQTWWNTSQQACLSAAQTEFRCAVFSARKQFGDNDPKVWNFVTDHMRPHLKMLSKEIFGGEFETDEALREREVKAYLTAMNDRCRIAMMSTSFWLGSVFLANDLDRDYIEMIQAYNLTPDAVLRHSLASFLHDKETSFLQIQPDFCTVKDDTHKK